MTIKIGLSFTPFVNWGQNIGGIVQGVLWGAVVLSKELENKFSKVQVY